MRRPIATPLQPHCHPIATPLPPHCHLIATPLQPLVALLFAPLLQPHCNPIATPLQPHCNPIATLAVFYSNLESLTLPGTPPGSSGGTAGLWVSSGRPWRSFGGIWGRSCRALGALGELLEDLWSPGTSWRGSIYQKLPINRPSGLYVIKYFIPGHKKGSEGDPIEYVFHPWTQKRE